MDLLGDFLYGKGSVGWSLYENIVEWKMACSMRAEHGTDGSAGDVG